MKDYYTKTTSYLPGLFCYCFQINGHKWPRRHGGYYLAQTDKDAIKDASADSGEELENIKCKRA